VPSGRYERVHKWEKNVKQLKDTKAYSRSRGIYPFILHQMAYQYEAMVHGV
jgi:hypothetical protein